MRSVDPEDKARTLSNIDWTEGSQHLNGYLEAWFEPGCLVVRDAQQRVSIQLDSWQLAHLMRFVGSHSLGH